MKGSSTDMRTYDTSGFQVSFWPDHRQLEELEDWLLQEEQKTGDGFYCNLHLLRDSFAKGEMAIAILERESIGFLT